MLVASKVSKMTTGWNSDRHQERSRHTEGNATLGAADGGGWPAAVEEGQDHRQASLWNNKREACRFWMKTWVATRWSVLALLLL